jgi:hypothetical protein
MSTEYEMALWSELNLGPMQLPEHALLFAILERAILDYVGPAKTPAHFRRDAEMFFHCKDDVPWSFIWISRHVPYDAEWFRETIMRYVNREYAKRQEEINMRRCGSRVIWK